MSSLNVIENSDAAESVKSKKKMSGLKAQETSSGALKERPKRTVTSAAHYDEKKLNVIENTYGFREKPKMLAWTVKMNEVLLDAYDECEDWDQVVAEVAKVVAKSEAKITDTDCVRQHTLLWDAMKLQYDDPHDFDVVVPSKETKKSPLDNTYLMFEHSKKHVWTLRMNKRLLRAYEEFEGDWDEVAAYVSEACAETGDSRIPTLTDEHCSEQYERMKEGAALQCSEGYVAPLKATGDKPTNRGHKRKQTTAAMQQPPVIVAKQVVKRHFKTTPFTAEEDEVVVRQLELLDGEASDLCWELLSEKLHRFAEDIRERWTETLCEKDNYEAL